MKTQKLVFAALLVSLGVITGQLIFIPVGVSRCFPVQHAINVLSAVLLGPWYAVSNAFLISLLRNILGTGSLLAFPGSMIGAFLAGLLYQYTGRQTLAILGEVFGTGILGGMAAYPIAKWILGKEVATFFVYPFLLSAIGGSLIAFLLLQILSRNLKNLHKSFEK